MPLSIPGLHELSRRLDVSLAAAVHRFAVARVQAFDIKLPEPVKGMGKRLPAPAGKIVAAECTIGKHGIPADECLIRR